MTWLVTGGAGYIGAHVVRAFQTSGIDVVVLDNLSSGHRKFVPAGVVLIEESITDPAALAAVFADHSIDGVVHLAGYKYAGESVKFPLEAYKQNVTGTAVLLEAMANAGVSNIVFSSSAAVYGTPPTDIVTESTPTNPQSPYGESKLIGEWLIRDQAIAANLKGTCLRYFNVVGSGTDDVTDTSPHNLFPLIFRALAEGRTPAIFGDDYPTPDGTCVRDYVHVADVASAHVAAAQALMTGTPLEPEYNLGSGAGTSVGEIMTAVKNVTEFDFTPDIKSRRAGDPSRIVADGELAARDLGWRQRHTVESMVASAWSAHRAHTN
ncbi:MAG: UDP-glucose 4-epimerase GalE [Microbacteriaceae bacterium]